MKVWIETLKRKSGDKLSVKCIDDNGKKMQRGIFEKNQKRQAKIFADSLRTIKPHLAMPAKVLFDTAFSEYKESVLKNELNTYETRLMACGYINYHIAPYINKKLDDGSYKKIELINDYTYYDFKEFYIPQLIKSKAMAVKNLPGGESTVVRTKKNLGKKAIKDAVANFKLFIKYCHSRHWILDKQILDFNFPKNFFQGENTKPKWMPKYGEVVRIVKEEKDPLNKALFHTAAETGVRLNELLALTYSDVDFSCKPALIYTNHSIDKWCNFRENFLKTATSKRPIEISKALVSVLKYWMKYQTPVRHGRYRLIFGTVSKKMATRRIKKSAQALDIKWENGMSPFRKFSQSYSMDQKIFTEAQLDRRYGNTKEIREKHYYRDLDVNKDERIAAINNMLLDA